MRNLYDVLVIPTSETNFSRDRTYPIFDRDGKFINYKEKDFPVSSEAVKLFQSGGIGYIFVTGGHSGLSKRIPFIDTSEAKEIRKYLESRGIPREKIYDDNRSREMLGAFAIPVSRPQKEQGVDNPNLKDFKRMMIICKQGHLSAIKDYTGLVVPDNKIVYYTVDGGNYDGIIIKKHHKGLMNVLNKTFGKEITPENIDKFLYKEHPAYSGEWAHKSIWKRKRELNRKARDWLKK